MTKQNEIESVGNKLPNTLETVFTLEIVHDEIVESVRKDILERSNKGQSTYGTTMDRNDLSLLDWHQNHYEELLDAAIYVKKKIELLKLNK